MNRATKALFGNLLDEFGDAAAPVIRKVLSALGADASEKVARDAVRREVRALPSQKTTRASSAAATPPKKKKAPASAPKPKAKTPPAQGSSLAAKPEKPLAAQPAAQTNPNAGFLDEGKWELPADFGADVPIVTIGPAIIPSRRPTTAWHGTPHVFAAERKVLTPTGEEIFIAGAPDVLPDVPADFSVLKDFPLGRFRSDRLGTGEGAQQYGIGTYVAENPEVARMYRNELTQDEGEPSIAGVPLEVFYSQLQRRADKADPDRAEALYNRLSSLEDLGLYGDVRGVLDLAETGAYSPETVDWFKREIVPKYSAPGALYEVEIGVDPREFLDYDRPLASQTETVRRAVANMDLSGLKEGNRSRVMLERFLQNKEQPEYQATGQTLLTALPHSPELEHTLEGSLYLLGQGIPGIRYQDFNSRGTPRGTSNFVVFDPERDLAVKNRFSRGGMAALTDNYGC